MRSGIEEHAETVRCIRDEPQESEGQGGGRGGKDLVRPSIHPTLRSVLLPNLGDVDFAESGIICGAAGF